MLFDKFLTTKRGFYLEKVVFFEIPHDRRGAMSPEVVHDKVEEEEPADHDEGDELGLVADRHQGHHRQADQVDDQILQAHCEMQQGHEHQNQKDSA